MSVAEIFAIIVKLVPFLGTSLLITVVVAAIGFPLGFLGGLLLNHRLRIVRYPVIALVELLRGFPALLTLYFVYFSLPTIGIVLDGFTAAVVGFSLTVAAYSAEIFRAAITSVPKGQREAGAALALGRGKIVRLVVLPHVLTVAIPPLLGILVIAFQGTSLALSIGVTELAGQASSFGQMTFTVLPHMIAAGILYLLVTSLLSWMEIIAERRAERFSRGAYRASKGRDRKASTALAARTALP